MTRIFLRAVDPRGEQADEKFTVDIPDPQLDSVTKEGNARVFDIENRDARDRKVRVWAGTASDLIAAAAVNPFTAAMFAIANRVCLDEGPPEIWEWERKTDGRLIKPDRR